MAHRELPTDYAQSRQTLQAELYRGSKTAFGPSLLSGVGECVAEESALAVEGLARVPRRVLHKGDLLREQASEVHGVGLGFARLASVKGMVSVDVDDDSLAETFRPIFAKVVQATGNPLVS